MTDNPQGGYDEENDPEFIGRFEIDGEGAFFVDAFRNADADEPESFDFRDLYEALDVDPNDKDFMLDQIKQSLEDADGSVKFDFDDNDARGPYTREEVLAFLDETEFWGIADVYYDEDFDEWYIDINYDDGANSK